MIQMAAMILLVCQSLESARKDGNLDRKKPATAPFLFCFDVWDTTLLSLFKSFIEK